MTAPTIFFSMTYSSGGESHVLNGYDVLSGYTLNLLEFNDVGLPPVSRITQKGAFQHGDTNIDYRLGARKFSLRGMIAANSSFENINVRYFLSRLFKVSNTAATVSITSTETLNEAPFTTTTIQRQIDCYVEGGLNFSSDTSGGYDVFYDVALYASNPLWYDPQETTITIAGGVTGDATDVPLTVPRTYGSTSAENLTIINYTGTFLSYPVITIDSGTAGITGLVIENTTQGTSIIVPTIQANTVLRVDLRYGYKTVLDQSNANRISLIDAASDLTTFALIPSLNTSFIPNNILVSTVSSGSDSSISLRYNTQYTAV
jgi:hypothetical protein